MNGSRAARRIVLLAAALTLALVASAAAATGVAIHFQRESVQAFEQQLRRGEVHAATFHEQAGEGHLHLSMNDGRHFTVAYASSEEPKLAALVSARGVPVAVAAAKPKKAATAVHHTLRYIAAGILIVVILVVAAVLLFDRRRKLNEEASSGEATPPTQSQPSQ